MSSLNSDSLEKQPDTVPKENFPVQNITLRRKITFDPDTGANIFESIDTNLGGEVKTIQRDLIIPMSALQPPGIELSFNAKQALLEQEVDRIFKLDHPNGMAEKSIKPESDVTSDKPKKSDILSLYRRDATNSSNRKDCNDSEDECAN